MKITESSLQEACAKQGIDAAKAQQLWKDLQQSNPSPFNIENVAYYVGAFIIMCAMAWFMGQAWDHVGGVGIAILGGVYAGIFFVVGRRLWFGNELKIPGGLLITLGVTMVPLIVFGIEKAVGFWPEYNYLSPPEDLSRIKLSWIIMELGTIIAGFIALRYVKITFLTFPIAFALWFLSMDVTAGMLGHHDLPWGGKQLVSIVFGFCMIVVAYFVDQRTKEDYAFWGYLFGMIAFWGGLSSLDHTNELHKFLYLLLNLGFILFSVVIDRRLFLVFGAVGVFAYLGHLAYVVFEDSLFFPIALSLMGIFVIYLGILYNRNKAAIEAKLIGMVPDFLMHLNPKERL